MVLEGLLGPRPGGASEALKRLITEAVAKEKP
jgi:hypothetical protein